MGRENCFPENKKGSRKSERVGEGVRERVVATTQGKASGPFPTARTLDEMCCSEGGKKKAGPREEGNDMVRKKNLRRQKELGKALERKSASELRVSAPEGIYPALRSAHPSRAEHVISRKKR